MIIRQTCIILTFLLSWVLSNSQERFVKSIDLNYQQDHGVSIKKGSDGYYVVSNSYCHQNVVKCYSAVKVNSQGDTLWKKQLDTYPYNINPPGFYSNKGVLLTNNFEDLLFYGEIESDSNYIDGFLMRCDTSGNSTWFKSYGSAFYDNITEAFQVSDSTITLFRTHGLNETSNNSVITEVDLGGNLLFENIYHDKYGRSINQDIVPSANGDYIFSYMACKENSLCKNGEEMVLKLAKMNKNGLIVWNKEIYSFRDFWANSSLIKLNDGGYLLSFYRTNFGKGWFYPPILIWTDSLGTVVNTLEFSAETESTILDLTINSDGLIIGVGTIDKLELGYAGWIFAVDPNGHLLWERSFIDSRYDEGFVQFNAVIENEFGDLIITGIIGDTLSNNNSIYSNKNIILVNTDMNGCLIIDCGHNQLITELESLNNINLLSIFPNPTNGFIHLNLPDNINNSNNIIFIYDAMGKIVKKIDPVTNGLIDIHDLNYGILYIKLYDSISNSIFYGTIVKF